MNQDHTKACIHLGIIVRYSCCNAPHLHECKLYPDKFTRPRGGPWTEKEIACCTCKSYLSKVE